MRVEQGFLADVHGERPEDLDYPGAGRRAGTVWVAARASYRRVLEQVTLADVVAGKLPAHVEELVAPGDRLALVRRRRAGLTGPSVGGPADPRPPAARPEGNWPPCQLRRRPASPCS